MLALEIKFKNMENCKDCKGGSCQGHGCKGMKIAKVLVIIGALNWGLIGLGMFMGKDWNLVKMIFGFMPNLEALIYVLVGVAAVMKIFRCKCKKCMGGVCPAGEKSEDKMM